MLQLWALKILQLSVPKQQLSLAPMRQVQEVEDLKVLLARVWSRPNTRP